MHCLWCRHHLLPSAFFKLPRGEQLFLLASVELETEEEKKLANTK